MAIRVKDKSEVIKDIQTNIRTDAGSGIATYENSDAYDLFINPTAELVLDTDIVADFISRSRSLIELEKVIRDAQYQDRLRFALNYTFTQVQQFISITLDNLVSNWNEVRKVAIKSKGIIRLYFTTNTNKTISTGLIVETNSGIQFQTTNSFTNFTPFYDSLEGLYYVDSAIEALASGQEGNLEAGSIINIVSSATGLQKVVNLQRTQFGRNTETDLQLIDRVRQSWASRNTTVISGFVRKLFNYPGIVDLSVVMPGDEDSVRNEKNAVDIYLLAETKVQLKEDTFNSVSARYAWERLDDELNYEIYPVAYDTTNYTAFKILSQPLVSVGSVSYSATVNGSYTNISSSNYDVIEDTDGVFAHSVRGHDYVRIRNSALPNNTWVKISYNYDRLYKDLQSLFFNYNTAIIGADILFKKASQLVVDINVIPKIFSGYVEQDVQDKIISDLNIYFEGGVDSNDNEHIGFKLGQKVDVSDIANIVIDVAEVDSIDLENFIVTIDGIDISQTFKPKLNQYLRLGTVTFSVNQGGGITPITSFTTTTND